MSKHQADLKINRYAVALISLVIGIGSFVLLAIAARVILDKSIMSSNRLIEGKGVK